MKKLLSALALVVLFAQPSLAVTLAWDANTEPDLAGYRLYQGMSPGGPYNFVKEFTKPSTSGSPVLVADGLYFWVLTAFDTVGNESGYSNEVNYNETSFPPSIPKSLRVSP